jgi:hypothetical protein
MKKLLTIPFVILALAGCANQLGGYGQKAIGEVQTFNDNTCAAALHAPCIVTVGTLTQQHSPAQPRNV